MKNNLKIVVCFAVLLFIAVLTPNEVLAGSRGDALTAGSSSQNLVAPAPVTSGCAKSDPSDVEPCPAEDKSTIEVSPGRAQVTVPQPGGNGFSFAGLCKLTGKANNICIEVVSCLENDGKCAITDCLQKPSLEECRQLCTSDPTNAACAAFDCATDPGEACCAIVRIPECCDFFDILDSFNSCRRNPGVTCCGLIVNFSGDTEFANRCASVLTCVTNADASCCELFP